MPEDSQDICCICKKKKPGTVSMMLSNCAHKVHIVCLEEISKMDYDGVNCVHDGCNVKVANKDKDIVLR